MQKALEIQFQLSRKEAEALLADERQRLQVAITELWYADCYRHTPAGLRSGAILTDHPHLAAHKRTIGALKAALAANL